MKVKAHVATVHWKSDYWIDIQDSYLKNFSKDLDLYKYGFLNGLNVQKYSEKFDYIRTDNIKSHAVKLDILAKHICKQANDDDLIMFLDGDAFPIADIYTLTRDLSYKCPLIAVMRKENLGDVQPHPCFCVTTVGFWKKINGSWLPGESKWKNTQGNLVSDVGGDLYFNLRKRNISWKPLIRSNVKNIHPLMFGIYGDVVYHHGAGFRKPASRIDKYTLPSFKVRKFFFELMKKFMPSGISRKLFSPYNKIAKNNDKLNKSVLYKIENNFYFFKELM